MNYKLFGIVFASMLVASFFPRTTSFGSFLQNILIAAGLATVVVFLVKTLAI